jgi:filamentous hemagglutinin family protein
MSGALVPLAATAALALPEGGSIAAGSATVSTPTATSMRIDQASDRLIMDWTRFNIAAQESVHFHQPSAAAIALNRVSGQEPSAIFGALSATGQVFLLNPSGILFGPSSRVDVGALTASTLTMTNQDFLNSQYRFTQDPSAGNAAVMNQGLITAGPGGYVALLGAAARNEGVIQANLGSIALAAGRAATLDLRGDGLIQFVIADAVSGSVNGPDGQPLVSSVSNTGTLQADGGMVTLHAKAAAGLVHSVVNQEGVVRATSLVNHGGVIKLIAEGDDAIAWNKGEMDVSAGESGAAPGSVTISAPNAGQSGRILATGTDRTAGGNVEITSSKQTGLFANSIIDVSGLGNADAGSVRVWSDNYTVFSSNATIVARGGETGGNGGFVEVSGKEALNVAGFVDARAPQGETGTFLLDPHNITVAAGGVGLLTDVDQFADTPITDVTIAPATINAALANVVLQANHNITFTNAVSIVGAGISLTAQAGRSIIVNASITTNNAPISLTANDTTANGVVDANRDAGSALITMAAGTSLTSGGSNITITTNTGAGLTNSTSGNITLEAVNAGAGNVLVTNNGPTAGSGIVRASANVLVTATSAAFDVNGAGAAAGIGTLAAPIRITVTNLEARSQSLGAYFTSPTLAVNLGGATLGSLTGISTSSNGILSVTTTGTSITTTEDVSANGSGTVSLTAAGAASSITTNAALISGTGAIVLNARNGITLSGANADITTTGAYTASADADANGTGAYTQNHAGSAVAAGLTAITAADIDLIGTLNAGTAAVALTPALITTTIGVNDASKSFSLSGTELGNIITTGIVTIGALVLPNANSGGITIGTDGAISENKALVFTTNNGSIVVAAAGLTSSQAITLSSSLGPITTNGPISTTGSKNILLSSLGVITVNAPIDAAGSGTIQVSAAPQGPLTGYVVINSTLTSGSGAITVRAPNDVTVSGAVTTTGAYTGSADNDSNGTGVYRQTAGGIVSSGSASLSGADIDLQGTVNTGAGAVTLWPRLATTTIGINDASKAFKISDAELSNITTTGTVTLGVSTNTGGITIGTDGAISQGKTLTFLSAGNVVLTANGLTAAGAVTMTTSGTGAITITGPLATTGNMNIALTTTNGGITTNGTINAAGSGMIVLTAAGVVNGSLAIFNALTSGSGAVALTAANGITLSGASSDVTTTGVYTANADSDSSSAGAYTQNHAGSAVSTGGILIMAWDIDLQGTLNAGVNDITLRPSTSAATIGVGDTGQNFNLSNAEIAQITTVGPLTIGGNSAGMVVATNESINAGSKNIELLTGGTLTVSAGNGFSTTGNLTLTANGLALNGGAISAANVALRPYSAATTIGVEDNSKTLSLTNAELNTIATSGILTIGRSSNTGGINIAVDGPVSLGTTSVSFITGGSIVIGTDNLTTSGNVVLTAGGAGSALALDWEFDEGLGLTAFDQSGHNNHGTLTNAPLRLAGGVLQFDGTNHIIAAVSNMPGTEMTYEFMLRTTDAVNQPTEVSYFVSGVASNAVVIDRRTYFLTINDVGTATGGVSANDGNWHHMVVTWRSVDGQALFFKDGAQVGSSTVKVGATVGSAGTFVVGQEQDCNGGCFDASQAFIGDMDFMRVWNRVLSPSEVLQLAADPSSHTNLFSTGTISGVGGTISADNLTLNASSVGTAATPVLLGSVLGQLSGTLSRTVPADVFNVKSAAPSTINLGYINATSEGIGHAVTIDSTGGSILHGDAGTDIIGGRVNLLGATIGALSFDLEVITDNPPVMCNGSPCGLPYFVNGATAIHNEMFLSGRYLLGAAPEQGRLLTAGVLPDGIYQCLDQDRKAVVCTAAAVWHDDDGTNGAEAVTKVTASSPKIGGNR